MPRSPSIAAASSKLTGDGVLAEFPSVVNAVSCATEIQTAMRARTSESAIQFRIGVNLGDMIAEGNDIYGDGVNVAARLEKCGAAVASPFLNRCAIMLGIALA